MGIGSRISLGDVSERFPSEGAAREFLEGLRWREGVWCPECGASEERVREDVCGYYACGHCGERFSVGWGTMFSTSPMSGAAPEWVFSLRHWMLGLAVWMRYREERKGDGSEWLRGRAKDIEAMVREYDEEFTYVVWAWIYGQMRYRDELWREMEWYKSGELYEGEVGLQAIALAEFSVCKRWQASERRAGRARSGKI